MVDIRSQLDRSIAQLATLGEFVTAWRPADALADAKLQADVSALLGTYPFLARDEGYVEFLRRYGGALLVREVDGLVLSLYGFSHDIGMHLIEGPGELVDGEGFLTLCDMVVPRVIRAPRSLDNLGDTVAVAFGFDTTGDRRWGVYRFVSGGAGAWYCETFLEWLRMLIAKDGQLRD